MSTFIVFLSAGVTSACLAICCNFPASCEPKLRNYKRKKKKFQSIFHLTRYLKLFKIIVITEKKEGKKRYKKNIENSKFCKYFLSFFLLFFFIFHETIPRSKARSSVYRVISGREIGQRRCGRSWLPYKSDCGQGASQLLVLNHFNRCCTRDGFKDRVILPLVPFRTE